MNTILSIVKSLYEANKSVVVQAITSAEGGAEAFIDNALAELKPSGTLGTVYTAVEPELVKVVKDLVTKEGAPTVIYSLIDALLAKAAG